MVGLADRYPGWEVKQLPLLTWCQPEHLLKVAASPRIFDRCYRNKPIVDEERVFPHFHLCLQPVTVREQMADSQNWLVVAGVDPSGKKRPGNAIVAVAIHLPTGKRMPVDCRCGAWSPNERIDQIAQMDAIWHPAVIGIENNAMQDDFVQMLADHPKGKTFAHKVQGVLTGAQKAEDLGLLDVQFANAAWIFPMGEICHDAEGNLAPLSDHAIGCTCAWCRLKTDLSDYTRDYDGSFDLGMGLYFCTQLLEGLGPDRVEEQIITPSQDGILYLDDFDFVITPELIG